MPTIALIGDFSAAAVAHQAIPLALARVQEETVPTLTWRWIQTRDVRTPANDLADCAAVWAVPASPYENMAGVLAAIRWARETRRPFLGTCGGFQHALLEFARNVLGITDADHAETNPTGSDLVVTRLACSLVEHTGPLKFAAHSRLRAIYGTDSAHEGYRCSFGPNVSFRSRFEAAGFRFTAFDELDEPRAAELSTALHPFFIGTLFQPERAALQGKTPPLVAAFAHAASQFNS
ncbi:MAG: hypothetical protein ABIZ04_15110 [Opitutus sp.]